MLLFFSDEATFYICGKVNRHNICNWRSENPHCIQKQVRNSEKVNVWCGIMNELFDHSSSLDQLDMLEQFVILEFLPLQPNVIFQQNGASPHWSLNVHDYLDRAFPQLWIGCDVHTRWLPHSLITPLDFFLRSYIKDGVYATPIRNVAALCLKITDDISTITPDLMNNI